MSQHPLYCPPWEYTNVAGHEDAVRARTRFAVRELALSNRARNVEVMKDTRSFHRSYFANLTPAGYDYYAVNYRGSNFACLQYCAVGVRSDPRVGHDPGMVAHNMQIFSAKISQALSEADLFRSYSSALVSDEDKLFRTVEIAAALFVFFLEIHPYVNGNGHMGRLILMCFLNVYGIRLSRFSVHPRPADPPYSKFIAEHRSGNQKPLIYFILSCI